MQKLSVSLTSPQLAELREEARSLGVPVGELIRRLIDAWRSARAGASAAR